MSDFHSIFQLNFLVDLKLINKKIRNSLIQQGCIKLIKRDSKDIYNVIKYLILNVLHLILNCKILHYLFI